MRFLEDGPAIPNELLTAQERGEVLFLCGAGVSMPTLPSFLRLADMVFADLGAPHDDEMWLAVKALLDERTLSLPFSLDQAFEHLQRAYGVRAVENKVRARLRLTKNAVRTDHHAIMLRLSKDAEGRSRVLTTNFDTLFDAGIARMPVAAAPILPVIREEAPLRGVVHLHGRVSKRGADADPGSLTLSTSDFGRAYLSQAWATTFMRDVLDRYVVVLVGYSADDPPVSYLLQGLRDAPGARRELYAFAEDGDGVAAGWRARGVTPILYRARDTAHSGLWDSLRAWARRADDPDAWREEIVRMAARGPRALTPFERGQVAAICSTDEGARAFARAADPPPGEWLWVFDAYTRYNPPGYERRGPGGPLDLLGLDDDPPPSQSKNAWERGAPTGLNIMAPLAHETLSRHPHGFAGAWSGHPADLPGRLQHLATWMARRWSDPAVLWWAGSKGHLNPKVLDRIEHAADADKAAAPVLRKAWALVREASDASAVDASSRWYDLTPDLKREGWTPGNLRRFAEVIRPRLVMGRHWRGLAADEGGSDALHSARDLVHFSVQWWRPEGELPHVGARDIASIVREIREGLRHGASLITDVEPYHTTPALDPEEGPGEPSHGEDDKYFLWFAAWFDRLTHQDTDAARAELSAWPPSTDIFDKLRVWAWRRDELADGDAVAEGLLGLPDASFWSAHAQREVLWTLRRRWADLTFAQTRAIETRILNGRPRRESEPTLEHRRDVAATAASWFSWLQKQNVALSDETLAALPALKANAGGWRESWGDTADRSMDGRGGPVHTDEDFTAVDDLPFSDVLAKCVEISSGRIFGAFTHRDPFQGLVLHKPRTALAVLGFEQRRGEAPISFWSALLQSWPDTAAARLSCLLAARLARLPLAARAELRHGATSWLQKYRSVLDAYRPGASFALWDALFDALRGGGPAVESVLVSDSGVPVEVLHQTVDSAFNAAVGRLARTLIDRLSESKPKAVQGLPSDISSRFEACLDAPGKGGVQAAAMIAQQLKYLYRIDPVWTETHLFRRLNLRHPHAVAAWDGFLWDNRAPQPKLFAALKPLLLDAAADAHLWSGRSSAGRIGAFIVLAAFWSTSKNPLLLPADARRALQSTTDEVRVAALEMVEKFVEAENGWRKHGRRFLAEMWPLEIARQTPATSRVWLRIAMSASDLFSEAADAIASASVLCPVDNLETYAWRMRRGSGEGDGAVAKKHPEAVLALLDCLVCPRSARAPYDLEALLETLVSAAPTLREDMRWRRMMAQARRAA